VQSLLLLQLRRHVVSTASHASVGPHWAQEVPGVVPVGHGSAQPISVHTVTWPSSQKQVLQL
jgi:hypothetical protein